MSNEAKESKVIISISLDKQELEKLDEMAKSYGMSRSAYLRWVSIYKEEK